LSQVQNRTGELVEVSMETIIQNYGYLAILVGTFLEGETVLILGGFAAQRGYLELPWVIAVAFIGTLCGDQLFFILGRWHSRAFLSRWPKWDKQIVKAERLLKRFKILLMLMFRFFYGLRSVTPFVIGMSAFPAPQFVLLNALAAGVWAVVIGTGGYFFGNALDAFLGNIKHRELQAFVAIAFIGILIWLARFYRQRKRK
jgi:membrane protein DedA with SNARE-associated domain